MLTSRFSALVKRDLRFDTRADEVAALCSFSQSFDVIAREGAEVAGPLA